jgi:D-glycero-alpha-D-manno-heptose-7-phosphate kinase
LTAKQLVCDLSKLEKHMILAYTGKTHPSSHQGSSALEGFKKNGDLALMVRISQQARDFAKAIQYSNYKRAGCALTKEFNLRSQLIPDILPKDDQILVESAIEAGCGIKPTGHGQGGCLWAIGTQDAITFTKKRWKYIFDERCSGYLIPFTIARTGLSIIARPK